MAKELIYNDEAWKKLAKGVDKVANAVKITLGPRGHNVVLEQKSGSPTITNDGVTIAKEIELEDPFENMGAQLIVEVASRANSVAGDGTTTATILGQAIFKEGLKNVVSGANAMSIKRGINKAVKKIVELIEESSKELNSKEDIEQVAAISANNDKEIGSIIAEAMDKVGKDGVITVEESKGMDTYVNVVEGLQFDKGYLSPYMVNNRDNMTATIDNALILLSEEKIANVKDILPILEMTAQAGRKLFIIAQDVEGEALATLVVNKLRGTLDVTAVKTPGFGDNGKAMLQDIATLTDATIVSNELGIGFDKITIEDLGSAKSVVVSKNDTTIVEGGGGKEKIEERIKDLKKEIEVTEDIYAEAFLKERLAKLSGGVAVMYAGAATETELKEKRHRIEDALQATRAAVEEGIVVGGGVTLAELIKPLSEEINNNNFDEDEKIGAKIVLNALSIPLKQIAENAGVSGDVVLDKILTSDKKGYGFNAATLQYCDLLSEGVVDPAKVTRSALQNAGSIAAMLLTTGCLIADKTEDEPQQPIIPQAGMPGMM